MKFLSEVNNIYNKLYFNESIIKKGEKLTNQIKINLNEGKIIDNEWNDNNKLISKIYGCIKIENNIEDINEINNNIKKANSFDIEAKFISKEEINKFIEMIKSFGKIIYNNEELFENILKKSKIIENEEQIKKLKSWLPYLNKDNIKCKLIYDAKRDGDKAETFHSLCDNKGATLIIISTSDKKKLVDFYLYLLEGIRDLYPTKMHFYLALIIMKNTPL